MFDSKTVVNVVIGLFVFMLVQKFVLSKIPMFSYEEDYED